MKTALFSLGAALAIALGATTPARAWETDSTHAGLTEQAATASGLHTRLIEQFGLELGLFDQLVVPPDDAPPLFAILRQLNPTHGYVPDQRGSQSALAWLVSGAVVADIPVAAARNHFFDPSRGGGLLVRLRKAGSMLGRRLALGYVGEGDAVPATEWITSKDNPLNLDGFYDQYGKAVLARTAGERQRHLAGALLAAGALLHVLQDMGSPSHVRNDFGAHIAQLSDEASDVGSRFERIAALAFGRLGVAAPARVVARPRVADYFHTDDGRGLADWTAASFFSSGTLPRDLLLPRRARARQLAGAIAGALRLPQPAPLAVSLDLIRAGKPEGATLAGANGVCQARYRTVDDVLSFSIDDDCAAEQIGALLPEVSAYSAGLLGFLFRGSLTVSQASGGTLAIGAGDVALGAGKLTVLCDDERGVRTAMADAVDTQGATAGVSLHQSAAPPAGARVVVAFFDGVDANGERLVAIGRLKLGE